MAVASSTKQISDDLAGQGYSLVRGAEMRAALTSTAYEAELAAEWDRLGPDNYLKNNARFRERRYGRFLYIPRERNFRLLAHQPYFQSETANRYAGGIHRVVEPVTEAAVKNPLMRELVEFDFDHFPVEDERLDHPWLVACHQFRIIARPEEIGEPTPEGVHRDEIDFGAIHLMSRTNADGGISSVYDNDERLTAQFQLQGPMDTMFWADRKVLHSVSPITVVDHSAPAVRDILILGYTCSPGFEEQ